MSSMVVTLDVLRVSGWLKARAYCRVGRWAYEARERCGPREVRGGRWAGATAQAARQGRALGWRGRGEGTHPKHGPHPCDAGRVNGQRLVEVLRALPSRKVGKRAGGWGRSACREVRGRRAGATA